MKKLFDKFLKRNKLVILIYLLTTILFVFSFVKITTSLLYLEGIENFLRYLAIGILFIYLLYSTLYSFAKITIKKYTKSLSFNFFTFLLSLILIMSSTLISDVFSSIENVGESSSLNYTSKLVIYDESEFDESSIIGMITNEEDVEGYLLANSIIEDQSLENEIVYYDTYIMMLYALFDGEIDAAFMQNNYISLYQSEEEFEDFLDDTEVIYTHSEERTNTDIVNSTNKTFDEPLTFLIMGVDSTVDGLNDSAAFNGDTLMMITFNPITLNVTMFSLPRDLMVPIACNNNAIAKINSSATYSTSCVIDTVENLTGIDVDYYVKINFKGVVDLVDALGGIEVDVEEPYYDTYDGRVCEQDSNRQFGDNLICFDSGVQLLDGEQALAYARNRKLYLFGDIDRIAHQQQVISALADSAMNINSYVTFESILKAVEKNIVTNMSASQILSSYDVLKSMLANALTGGDIINIEKSYLEYYDLRVYMPSYGAETAGLGYYKDSLDDIIQTMRYNLELDEEEIITTFSFERGEIYEQKISGTGYKSETSYLALTSFVGMGETSARTYCSTNNIVCSFVTVDSTSDYYNSGVSTGVIGAQSVREKTLLNNVSAVTLYINGAIINTTPVVPEIEEEPAEEHYEEPEVEDDTTEESPGLDDIMPTNELEEN
ncbi:MAG: LCP family protein [bacterium]